MTLSHLGALVIILTVGCGYWQSSPVGMDTAPQVWAATPSLRNGERQALARQGQASIDSATGRYTSVGVVMVLDDADVISTAGAATSNERVATLTISVPDDNRTRNTYVPGGS